MTDIINPFPYFPEAATGGFIYVGEANQDARTNPITVYRDAALTLPWAQPIRTVDGYPAYQGAQAGIYSSANPVSMTVLDSQGAVVLNQQNVVNAEALDIAELQTFNDFGRQMQITGPFVLTDLGPTLPETGIYMGVGGNSLSFQNLISNPTGGADYDNQRAMMLLNSETSDDGNSQEQTLQVTTKVSTGYAKTWTTSTAFALGDNVKNVATNNVYRCTTAGTSAASGTGPSGKGVDIVDGTAVWKWINDDAVRAKSGIYNEIEVIAGGGRVWGQATNVQLQAGYNDDFAVGTEIDLKNNSGVNSELGGLNRIGLYVVAFGNSRSTAAAEITTTNTGSDPYAAFWGLIFAGGKLAERSVLQIDTSSAVGLGFGNGAGAGGVSPVTFTTAAIVDSSTSPKGASFAGTYSSAAVEVTGSTPAAFVSGGTKAASGFYDLSTAPRGLILEGTYSKSPMRMTTLPPSYADDTAAAAGGLAIGDVYRTGSTLKVRVA